MSNNHIRLKYGSAPKPIQKSSPMRLSENADLRREVEGLHKTIVDLQGKLNEVIKHQGENAFKNNKLVEAIQRTIKASGDTIISSVISGSVSSGGSSSTTDSVRVQQVAVVAGVATTIVFEQPSERLGVPECWYLEGNTLWKAGYDLDDTGLPSSFTITPQTSGYCTTSYKFL